MTIGAGAAVGVMLSGLKRAPRLMIGVLLPVPDADTYIASLRAGMRDLGWNDGSNFALEVREADGTVQSFRKLGEELAARPVDILITASTAAALALKTVTKTIPVIFVGTFDPVAAGLVGNLKHPDGNLTGIAGLPAAIGRDWVTCLQTLAPSVKRVRVFFNPASISPGALEGWTAAMRQIVDVTEMRIDRADQIERAVAHGHDSQSGIVVLPHPFPFAHRHIVVQAMANHRVPAIYGIAEMVRSGGLISYGQNLAAQWKAAARYIVQIANGVPPSDLPVTLADSFDLAINRGAASALGLGIPASLLRRANALFD